MSSNELTDVTLVSEDKKEFKAHKVVLSASSSVLKSIIKHSKLSRPIIHLEGIQSPEIESILQFIYLGESSFYKERMNKFLKVAKNLEVKNIEIPENDQHDNVQKQIFGHESIPLKVKRSYKKRPLEDRYNVNCNKCNYKASKPSNLQIHMRSIHDGVKYPCDQCNYKASQSGSLKLHIKSIHEGAKYYLCDQCKYKTSEQGKLQKHIKSKHKGAL